MCGKGPILLFNSDKYFNAKKSQRELYVSNNMVYIGISLSLCHCFFYYSPSRPLSPVPHFADSPEKECTKKTVSNIDVTLDRTSIIQDVSSTDSGVGNSIAENLENSDNFESQAEFANLQSNTDGSKWLDISTKDEMDGGPNLISGNVASTSGVGGPVGMEPLPRDCSSHDLASWQQNNLAAIAQINADDCGTPLQIFSKVI